MTDIFDENGNPLKEITLTVGGEPRVYPMDILSDDAKKLIIRDARNSQVRTTFNEVVRLIINGFDANAAELANALPQTGYTIPKPQDAPAQDDAAGLQDEVGVVDDAEIVVEDKK